jgi:hypothetical protein
MELNPALSVIMPLNKYLAMAALVISFFGKILKR